MGWLGKRRRRHAAAYRAQWAISVNYGYMAWIDAWSEEPRAPYDIHPSETPRAITAPLLARSPEIDEALHALITCPLPGDLTELVERARRLLQPLLDLNPDWLSVLTSRHDPSLPAEKRRAALDMDFDCGGGWLKGWQHEESAISAAIAVVPLLDQVLDALIPYTGINWVGSETRRPASPPPWAG